VSVPREYHANTGCPARLNDGRGDGLKILLHVDDQQCTFARPRIGDFCVVIPDGVEIVGTHFFLPFRSFTWPNAAHLHSGIDYVISEQCHRGLRDQIVAEREAELDIQQNWRKQVNRYGRDPSQDLTEGFITSLTPYLVV
jgi:hypothetical protein